MKLDVLRINKQFILNNHSCFFAKNVDVSGITWMGVGGVVSEFFVPFDLKSLSNFLFTKNINKNIYIIGECSNILIKDGYLDCFFIKLGVDFSKIFLKNGMIYAGASALTNSVARFAKKNSICGFEFMVGIPGSIGGAIAMNAGCYGSETSDLLISIVAMDRKGNIFSIEKKDINFFYRGSDLDKLLIICGAFFKCSDGNSFEIKNRMLDIQKKRYESQPIHFKTTGCTFRNHSTKKAWQLIDESGCRGIVFGGCEVSNKHCNFIINNNNANASDVIGLIEHVKQKVFTNTGINLELEVKIIP